MAWIDVSAHPTASASFLIVSDRTVRATLLSSGELLIDVSSCEPLLTSVVSSSGATHVHSFVIPAELRGCELSLQALVADGRGSLLTNVLDVAVR